jgi:crossover junction endodeoxyribonuclease RusA
MLMIKLPFPPSTNTLYRNVRGRGRVKTARYNTWIAAARLNVGPVALIDAKIVLDLTLGRPDRRRRDVSNLIKAVEDLMVKCNVIADDSQVEEVRARWGQVDGCEVRIWEAKDASQRT